MKKHYVTVTGFNHYFGVTPFKIGKTLKCVKEPDNPYDGDAIVVKIKNIGTVGYVANTPYTSATGTYTAGRIYSKVSKNFKVKVRFITNSKVICEVISGMKVKEKMEPVKQERE